MPPGQVSEGFNCRAREIVTLGRRFRQPSTVIAPWPVADELASPGRSAGHHRRRLFCGKAGTVLVLSVCSSADGSVTPGSETPANETPGSERPEGFSLEAPPHRAGGRRHRGFALSPDLWIGRTARPPAARTIVEVRGNDTPVLPGAQRPIDFCVRNVVASCGGVSRNARPVSGSTRDKTLSLATDGTLSGGLSKRHAAVKVVTTLPIPCRRRPHGAIGVRSLLPPAR
jgi:hypothetical protein